MAFQLFIPKKKTYSEEYPYFYSNKLALIIPKAFKYHILFKKNAVWMVDYDGKNIGLKPSNTGLKINYHKKRISVNCESILKSLKLKETPRYISMDNDIIVFSYAGCE